MLSCQNSYDCLDPQRAGLAWQGSSVMRSEGPIMLQLCRGHQAGRGAYTREDPDKNIQAIDEHMQQPLRCPCLLPRVLVK